MDRCPENAASCLRHRLAAGVLGFEGEGTRRSYPTHHTLRGPAQQSTPLASRTPRGLCGEVPRFLPTPPPCGSCGVWRLLLVDAAPSSLGTWPLPYCCPSSLRPVCLVHPASPPFTIASAGLPGNGGGDVISRKNNEFQKVVIHFLKKYCHFLSFKSTLFTLTNVIPRSASPELVS